MHFCPCCGNLLLIEEASGGSRFCCPTCAYTHNIVTVYETKTVMARKQVDDILGGESAWENVDRTSATCPHCGNKEAFFMQIQIRSADEPTTIFYKCCSCKKQWND